MITFLVTVFHFLGSLALAKTNVVSCSLEILMWRETRDSFQRPHKWALNGSCSPQQVFWDYDASQYFDQNFVWDFSQNCLAKLFPDSWLSEIVWNNNCLLFWVSMFGDNFCVAINNEYTKEEWLEMKWMMWYRTSQILVEFEFKVLSNLKLLNIHVTSFHSVINENALTFGSTQ